jgi:putative tryptophan/tyrosine transport system substrate-binding protein
LTQPSPVVLYLAPGSQRSPFHDAFVEALEGQGFRHGAHIDLRWVFAGGVEDPAKLRQLVADAIRDNAPKVIVTASTPLTEAAKAAAKDIPIVMTISGSPVLTGLVAQAERPGANVTGMTSESHELSRKQLETLRDHVRGLDAVALIWNPNNPAKKLEYDAAVRAGRELGFKIVNEGAAATVARRLEVTGDESDFNDAFRAARASGAKAVIVLGDPVTVRNRAAIAAAGREGPPAMYESSDFVEAGGLMAYGPDRRELYRQAGRLVARVLKGEHPRAIPVHGPARLEFKINEPLATEMRGKGLM